MPRLPITAVHPTTTTSACGTIAHRGRPSNHHDFRPVLRLPMTAARPTAAASACAAIADHGRLPSRHGFGLCLDCSSRPSAEPPRLRPVLRLHVAAVCADAMAVAFIATAYHGLPPDHHGFGWLGETDRRQHIPILLTWPRVQLDLWPTASYQTRLVPVAPLRLVGSAISCRASTPACRTQAVSR